LRKGDPVVHVKQPDRHRALRALEKVHERLDFLNEKYYAQLERRGEVLSLEEIERRADEALAAEAAELAEAEAAARDILKKGQVLSGSVPEAETGSMHFSEKHMVLSGSVPKTEMQRPRFSEKPQVLSGSPGAKVLRLKPLVAAVRDGLHKVGWRGNAQGVAM
jgi:hypothetical protein